MKYIKAIVEYKVPVSTENPDLTEVAAGVQLEYENSAVSLDNMLSGAEVISVTCKGE